MWATLRWKKAAHSQRKPKQRLYYRRNIAAVRSQRLRYKLDTAARAIDRLWSRQKIAVNAFSRLHGGSCAQNS